MTSCSYSMHVTDYYKEKHILICLSANQVSLPLNYFIASFAYSKVEGFFLLICGNSLQILYTDHLFYILQKSFPILASLLTLLVISSVLKFLTLMWSNYFKH